MRILVRLSDSDSGTWHTLDHGFVRCEQGVVDAGYESTSPFAWLALYGGNQINDDNLVLHLDDFGNAAGLNSAGAGKIYIEDNLVATSGKLSWRLIDGFSGSL